MNKNSLYFFGGLALVALDQLSKFIAAKYAAIFRNYEFAFSLSLPDVLMYAYYFIILGVIVWYVWSRHRKFTPTDSVAWTLILAGAVSNIGERLLLGYVRDFIYIFTGIFNVADFYILLGIILLLVRPRLAKSV